MADLKGMNFLAKFKLSGFLNSRVMDIENDDGVMEKGIFIPIEMNELYVTPNNQVIAWLFVNERVHDTGDGYSHYIKLKLSKKHIDYLRELGYDSPYVGLMKSSKYFGNNFRKNNKNVKVWNDNE